MTGQRLRSVRVFLLVFLVSGCADEDPLNAVRDLQRSRRFAESIEPLRSLLDESPRDPELNQLYGVALLATGQPSLAVWPLQRAAESPELAVTAGLQLAMAQVQSSSMDDAVASATRVLEIEPDNGPALALRASTLLWLRRAEAAQADVERALALAPDDPELLVLLVSVLLGQSRGEEAAQALDRARSRGAQLENAPPAVLARLCVANASLIAEVADVSSAKVEFAGCLEQWPAKFTVVRHAIEFYDGLRDYERATEILKRANREAPQEVGFRIGLAERLRALGRADEAERLLLDASVSHPSFGAWTALADHYVAVGDFRAALDAIEQAIEANPDPLPVLYFAYADTLIQLGEYEHAERVASDLAPDSEVMSNLLRGRILLQRGEHAEALRLLEAGILRWPNNPTARYLAGQAAERTGDFDRAISEYREAVRADASFTDAGLELARLHFEEARYTPALEAIGHHTRSHPGDAEGLALGVRIASRLGRADLVKEGLRHLVALPGQRGRAAIVRAQIEGELRGPQAAAKALERFDLDWTDPENAATLGALVDYLSAAGNAEAALARAQAAANAHPDVAEFQALRAVALAANGRTNQEVQHAFERALEINANYAPALAGLARCYAERGGRSEALAFYDRASAADPEDPDAVYAAIGLLPADQSREAKRRLEALLAQFPRHAAAANRLARLLAREGELGRAHQLAQRAVRFSDGSKALVTLGWMELERGEPEAGLKYLRRAHDLGSKSPMALYQLGRALAASGDAEGAREFLRAALEHPGFEEHDAARSELARVEAGIAAQR